MSFKVGDCIVITTNDSVPLRGRFGYVREIRSDGTLSVELVLFHKGGCNLNGLCPMGYGYYIRPGHARLVHVVKDLIKTFEGNIPTNFTNRETCLI